MATPIPIAKPNSSGTGGLIALLLLLALLGGENYLLATRDAQLHPTLEMVAQAARVKEAEATAKLAAAKAKKDKVAAPPGQLQPLDLSSMMGTSADGGPGMMDKGMAYVNEYEEMGAGLGIRFVMILACVALLFMQKPPVPKVGAQRRYARNPKTIVVHGTSTAARNSNRRRPGIQNPRPRSWPPARSWPKSTSKSGPTNAPARLSNGLRLRCWPI